MRLQLVGNYTLEEFEVAVSKVVESLRENKINSFQGVNIYLRTCVDGSEVKFTNNGQEVEHLVFDHTHRRNIPIKAGGLSIAPTYKMDISDLDKK